jgi:hypothetical protein
MVLLQKMIFLKFLDGAIKLKPFELTFDTCLDSLDNIKLSQTFVKQPLKRPFESTVNTSNHTMHKLRNLSITQSIN